MNSYQIRFLLKWGLVNEDLLKHSELKDLNSYLKHGIFLQIFVLLTTPVSMFLAKIFNKGTLGVLDYEVFGVAFVVGLVLQYLIINQLGSGWTLYELNQLVTGHNKDWGHVYCLNKPLGYFQSQADEILKTRGVQLRSFEVIAGPYESQTKKVRRRFKRAHRILNELKLAEDDQGKYIPEKVEDAVAVSIVRHLRIDLGLAIA